MTSSSPSWLSPELRCPLCPSLPAFTDADDFLDHADEQHGVQANPEEESSPKGAPKGASLSRSVVVASVTRGETSFHVETTPEEHQVEINVKRRRRTKEKDEDSFTPFLVSIDNNNNNSDGALKLDQKELLPIKKDEEMSKCKEDDWGTTQNDKGDSFLPIIVSVHGAGEDSDMPIPPMAFKTGSLGSFSRPDLAPFSPPSERKDEEETFALEGVTSAGGDGDDVGQQETSSLHPAILSVEGNVDKDNNSSNKNHELEVSSQRRRRESQGEDETVCAPDEANDDGSCLGDEEEGTAQAADPPVSMLTDMESSSTTSSPRPMTLGMSTNDAIEEEHHPLEVGGEEPREELPSAPMPRTIYYKILSPGKDVDTSQNFIADVTFTPEKSSNGSRDDETAAREPERKDEEEGVTSAGEEQEESLHLHLSEETTTSEEEKESASVQEPTEGGSSNVISEPLDAVVVAPSSKSRKQRKPQAPLEVKKARPTRPACRQLESLCLGEEDDDLDLECLKCDKLFYSRKSLLSHREKFHSAKKRKKKTG